RDDREPLENVPVHPVSGGLRQQDSRGSVAEGLQWSVRVALTPAITLRSVAFWRLTKGPLPGPVTQVRAAASKSAAVEERLRTSVARGAYRPVVGDQRRHVDHVRVVHDDALDHRREA